MLQDTAPAAAPVTLPPLFWSNCGSCSPPTVLPSTRTPTSTGCVGHERQAAHTLLVNAGLSVRGAVTFRAR
jgi:hypothetical protein